MSSVPEPPYYRIYGDYRGPSPVFYDRAECPWLDEVVRHWATIRDEYLAYRATHGLPPDSYIPDDVDVRGWRSINFLSYRHRYPVAWASMPRTAALLAKVPHLTTAFLTVLEPHAHLPPHNGDTNTTYRCHLGLIVPGPVDVCGMEVGGHRVGWAEGEAFAFNEAFRHRVWNDTDRERVILVFDVLRPAYRDRMLEISGNALAAIVVTALEARVPVMRRAPTVVRRLLHRALGLAARVVLIVRDGVRGDGKR